MTIKQIEAKQVKDNIKFEVSKRIREILEEAKKEYGAKDWDADDVESEIDALVFETE